MRCIDIIVAFELEINKIDDAVNKPVTDDTIYWLNQAIVKFVKERFNGNLPHRTSYEQNEKRTRDLINLLQKQELDPIIKEVSVDNPVLPGGAPTAHLEYRSSIEHEQYMEYEYEYPNNMMFVLNEDVVIADLNNKHKINTCVFECTADDFMYRINNSLTDFHYKYHRARPLRVRTKNGCLLLTDKNYKINSFTIGYIKVPTELTNENPNKDYTDFPEYIWPEIIKIAALMYIENQADPRYQTLTNEVLTQE